MRNGTATVIVWIATGLAVLAGPMAAAALAGTTGRTASTSTGTTTTGTNGASNGGAGGGATGTTTTATTTTGTTTTTTTPSQTDAASDRAGLVDYREYLRALVNDEELGAQRDQTFTNTIKQGCAGVLKPVSTLAPSKVSSTVLSDLGEEIGGDLTLQFLSEADKPFAQLSSEFDSLPWTEAPPPEAIDGLLSAERALLALAPSQLCIDARSLALHPKLEPAGSEAFLAHYLDDSATLKLALNEFLSVLSRFASSDESKLIKTIDHLVATFASTSAATERTDADTVLTTLGLNS